MTNLNYTIEKDILTLTFNGDFIHFTQTENLYQIAQKHNIRNIIVNGKNIEKWDSSLLLILFELNNISKKRRILFSTNNLPQGLQQMFEISQAVKPFREPNITPYENRLDRLGNWAINIYEDFNRGLNFSLSNLKTLTKSVFDTTAMRRIDFLFALQDCGPGAVGIVSLISFMVGLILAFVGAIELKTFGAELYVASLVTIGMIRIMGAIMCGIIMAGRTGASFAATLGTMQANEEIDALKTMGISINEFLILPRLSALLISMPLLTVLSDFMGMIGGGFVGIILLNLPAAEYWKYSWLAWSNTNFWIGIFHGFIYAFIISLSGCYYGINSGRNANGVGTATTNAVVSSIVWMIVATGIITVILEKSGL